LRGNDTFGLSRRSWPVEYGYLATAPFVILT